MEGMLWNANHVLDSALDPKSGASSGKGGIPKDLIKKCYGVVLISVVEAGFIFSGSVGTGVLMAHYPKWDTWSAPSAVSLTGIGFGFFVGKGARDMVILIMDPTLKEVSGMGEIRFGHEMDTDSKGGHSSTDLLRGSHSFVFSKGFFVGTSLDTSVLVARNKENERFYGKKATPKEILFEGAVTPPENSGVPMLHRKLNMIKAGKTAVITPENSEAKENLRIEAENAAEEAKADHGDELEFVDSVKEAAKEEEKRGGSAAVCETKETDKGEVEKEEEGRDRK